MSPKPRVAAPETDVVRPITAVPRGRRRRTRRWPILVTLVCAVGASLALWWAIFAMSGALFGAFT